MFVDEEPTLETLDFAFHIGSTPTSLYFNLHLNIAYAAHYVRLFHCLLFTYLLWYTWQGRIKLARGPWHISHAGPLALVVGVGGGVKVARVEG